MSLQSYKPLTPELLSELKRLHFQSKRLADEGVAGRYRSAFRGTGIEFEEVREYVPGDDIRQINWKVTARSGRPYVKSYREERELTVVVAVDLSASTHTGTKVEVRAALIAKAAAILTLIALKNNDKVGLVTFSDRIESFYPPKKARSAAWRILHEVMQERTLSGSTDIAEVCRFLSQVSKRRSIIFLLSDFFAENYEIPLATLSKRHDVTAISLNDPADRRLPSSGLLRVKNPETGEISIIDCKDSGVRDQYEQLAQAFIDSREALFRKYRVHSLPLSPERPFLDDLKRYLDRRKREMHQVRYSRV